MTNSLPFVCADTSSRAVSCQGRAVVFTSTKDDLVTDDTHGVADVYVQRGH